MIRFACPRCGAVFKAPGEKAGEKFPCPRCGQRLQVPTPLEKTVLGQPLPPRFPQAPIGAPQAVPVVLTVICPHCHAGAEVDASLARSGAPCPRCGGPLLPPVPQPAPRPVAIPVNVPDPPAADDDPSGPIADDRPTAPQPARRTRWRRWAATCVVVALAAGVCGVAVRLVMTGGYLRGAGQVPEDRPHARVADEELVERFIRNNADDWAEVEFLCWGPHLTPAENLALAQEAGTDRWAESLPVAPYQKERHERLKTAEPFRAIVRVRYRASGVPLWWFGMKIPVSNPHERFTRDELFWVQGKAVIPLGTIPGENGHWRMHSWLQEAPDKKVGDQWKQNLRRCLAKEYPGIEVEGAR
jgi:hypothetical protein